jgi:hypothetical protein
MYKLAVNIIIILALMLLSSGCNAKPIDSTEKMEVKVLYLEESDPVKAPEIKSKGFARTRINEISPEQRKIADAFAEALAGRYKPAKPVKNVMASKPQLMGHMQSSVPLQWMPANNLEQAMRYGKFVTVNHKSESPEQRDTKDKGRGWRNIK